MPNDVKLGSHEYPISEELSTVTVGGERTSLEISRPGGGARINGGLQVTGDIKGNIVSTDLIVDDIKCDDLEAKGSTVDLQNLKFTMDGTDQIITGKTTGASFAGLSLDLNTLLCTIGDALVLNNNDDERIFYINVANSSNRIYPQDNSDNADYSQIQTVTNGATTITTVDGTGAEADLILNIDGYVDINSASGENILLDAVGTGKVFIDKDYTDTTATTTRGLHIDVDRTGTVTSGSDAIIALDIDVDQTGATSDTTLAVMTGISINALGDSGAATTRSVGVNIFLTGTDEQEGIKIRTDDASTAKDLKITSSTDVNDYFGINTVVLGATTITTVDNGGEEADLTFNIDGFVDINSATGEDITLDSGGDIILDSATGGFEMHGAGTTAKFADMYAGMILGYTEVFDDNAGSYQSTTTSYDNLMKNFDSEDHYLKVAFVVPPSNKVEIEVHLPSNSRCDGSLYLGLATDASDPPTTLHEDYERSAWDVDETDEVGILYKWIIHGSDHSWSAGDSKVLYATIKELAAGGQIWQGDAALKNYGAWTMKATALPATVGDGT